VEQRLSVITLGVKNLEESLKFYRDGLGWEAQTENEGIVFFQLNGMIFALFPKDELAKDATIDPAGSGFPGFTVAYCARSEQDVDDIMAQAARIGARIVKPAEKVFWGGYSGYFADPAEYLWEVAFNPFWKLDEKGNVSLR
jgi:catechol 2,3-dioxygenase-like lactoylglutathione lyase family enzyme